MKIKLIVIAMLCFVTLMGCGGQSNTSTPTEATKSFLDAIKNENREAINEYYEGETDPLGLADTEVIEESGLSEENESAIIEKILSFEYTIENEKISDDSSTVDVTINTYDFGIALQKSMSEMFDEILPLIFSEQPSEEEMNAMLEDILMSNLSEANFDYVQTVELELIKNDDRWQVAEIKEDHPLVNAILGGIPEVVTDISDSFGNLGIE